MKYSEKRREEKGRLGLSPAPKWLLRNFCQSAFPTIFRWSLEQDNQYNELILYYTEPITIQDVLMAESCSWEVFYFFIPLIPPSKYLEISIGSEL